MTRGDIRTALYLFHVQGMDTVEIAQRFGEPEYVVANAFAQNSGMRREFLREGWGTRGGNGIINEGTS